MRAHPEVAWTWNPLDWNFVLGKNNCRGERTSTIITSNKIFSERSEFLGDPVIATAILDRLLHHCRVNQIKGNSYRMKNYHDRLNLTKEHK
ncbi:ATP-binding protein [bacterium]|nr:ATP-binding protein [candidate division CSSED10-310 bacterium]